MSEKAGRQMKTSVLFKRFLPYYSKYKKEMAFDLFCALLTTLCEVIFPQIIKLITNQAVEDFTKITTEWVLKLGGIYLLLRVIDTAANYFMQYWGHVTGTKLEKDMRTDLFSHLQQLSFSYYNNTKIGQIMSRITSDLFDITEFSHHFPEEVLIAVVKIVASFIILCTTNVWLTLLIFAILPFMLIGTSYYSKKMRAAFKESRHQLGEVNAQVEDSLLGVRVVKSFANEGIEEEKFGKGNLEFFRLKKLRYRYMSGFHTVTRFFDGLMYIVVVVVGALFLSAGKIDVGSYVAYLLYINTLLTSIRRIVEFTEQFQNGMTGIERFCEVMDAPIEIQNLPGAKELGRVQGEVTFDHVGFHYSDDTEHEVLENLNMHVKPGQNVAVVGPSGSGKTTLCNLIPRFYDVTEGRILIDGQDIKKFTLHSLRSAIGMVQQEVYLFSGTVKDNIAYGKPGATEKDIITAAKQAGAHDFIMKLPNGYDTYIGERGVKLSGGQKQRLSIARVFLKNPPILILDEATSALDNESELLVQRSLEKLAKGRTTFTIAHRLTTIRNADVIWVLTEKGVEETGTHQQLMDQGGIYSHMYSMYTTDRTE
ncbi:MAG: ABC transporter ATP-binding protein [Clostridia bacterium]|nr:ABC transporter ATP-binding protein [Clostridia bacterium]